MLGKLFKGLFGGGRESDKAEEGWRAVSDVTLDAVWLERALYTGGTVIALRDEFVRRSRQLPVECFETVQMFAGRWCFPHSSHLQRANQGVEVLQFSCAEWCHHESPVGPRFQKPLRLQFD